MVRLDERKVQAPGAQPPRRGIRVRDRRSALARLVGVLAQHLGPGQEAPTLSARLEAGLQEALRAKAVRLRENPPPYVTSVRPQGDTPGCACAEVPTRAGTERVVLEATFDPGTTLDAWDRQLLAIAAQLAALVVELDRYRCAPAAGPEVTRRPDFSTPPLIGTSPAMSTLRENIARVASTDFTVLIQGESGTGKELVAQQIHRLSRRRHGPFVAVNCAAIVESLLEAELFGIEDHTATGVRGRRGKFEHADGGTLFLDEVSDLTPSAQAKLLRAIQELMVERVGGHASRKVDTRIVVATNRGLRELVAAGQFREDLYYRLSGVELHVPPLRARRQDIPGLCGHFLSRYQTAKPLTLTAEASEALQVYAWPGNVRELERLVEGVVTLATSDLIAMEDLPPALRGDSVVALQHALSLNETMRAWGARYARLVLNRCEQNKRKACGVLDISYHTLMAYLQWRPDQPPSERRPREWVGPEGGEFPAAGPTPASQSTERAMCG